MARPRWGLDKLKQVLQNLRSGATLVEDVPAPLSRPGHLRIATSVTLVSAGTERMLVDFSRGSLVSKARQQPDKVRQAFQKMRTDGVLATVDAIRSKLDEPLALGYCNVGRVVDGDAAHGFMKGDRVVSNGKHAEVVLAPVNLCAHIPDGVADEHAAFTVLGAIALQGVRLAQPTLGESFAVFGLGMIGLMAVQMLVANGCRVLGIDSDAERLRLARSFGAEVCDLAAGENPLAVAETFARGRGVDGVLLTLSSTSDEPVSAAAQMCRKRGRIILVGVTGLKLNRADFFEKEISFQVSCSYGPGRYDPLYEEQGQDYPIGFVRWTEQRNFEAVLDLMASGRLDVSSLISHRMEIDRAPEAYDILASGAASLGIVLHYPSTGQEDDGRRLRSIISLKPLSPAQATAGRMAFVGAGNYGGRILVKAFEAAGANLDTIVSASGVSAARHGRNFGFRQASSDAFAAIADPAVDTVCIATRHDSHARFTIAALEAGKHVFVEKPLALTLEDVDRVGAAADGKILMVGFNRRFAPMIVRTKALLDGMSQPKVFVMTVNAGAIPADHWTQDAEIGGGRLVGEACHFIDLLRHLAGARVASMKVTAINRGAGTAPSDIATITLGFEDGSIGTVHYLANGHKDLGKERLEVFCGGRVLQLDNYRRLIGYGWPGFRKMTSFSQDKGQTNCAAAFLAAVRGTAPAPIPLDELLEVSRLSIEAAEQAAG
jgi:predicted dehydrogenase/threonine dehydrogenase-like Zn-dependent dehydrogenase